MLLGRRRLATHCTSWRRNTLKTRKLAMAANRPCTCTCAAHANAATLATSASSSSGAKTAPFMAPALAFPSTAFPSPFHSHSLARTHSGGHGIHSSHAPSFGQASIALTSPVHQRASSTAASTSGMSALPQTTPGMGSTSARSISSSPHSRGEISPFVLKGKKGMGTQTAEAAAADASDPATKSANPTTTTTTTGVRISHPIPDHIHSATCGCSTDHTIDADDQLIADGGGAGVGENGSEAFLSGMRASISALNAVTDSLAQEESSKESHYASPTSGLSSAKWNLPALLEHNHRFVMRKEYEPFLTSRIPYKRLVVVSCMDTRLTELLPMALDLKNGDAKIIKVAGAMVAHPFGSVMRSILVAVYALGAEHILVVGHHDCGMTGLDSSRILTQAKQRGIPDATFKTLKAAGLDLDSWLSGFDNVKSSVLHSVETIKNHPLLNFEETQIKVTETLGGAAATHGGDAAAHTVAKMRVPKITVTGMVICPTSGKLDVVTPVDPEIQAIIQRNEAEQCEAQASEKETLEGHRDALSA